jgi:hypothetical protein
MKARSSLTLSFVAVCVTAAIGGGTSGLAQVNPVEILNPRLKAAEQAYLTRLTTLNRVISEMRFPFPFWLSRYAGLDPKEQNGSDTRGLEFVNFHDRLVLKLTGNYNAAFNADLLTANQRSNRVFDEVIVPIIRLLPSHFSAADNFDDFGFEIAFHVRRKAKGYEVEGKEILVVVLEKADAFAYSLAQQDSKRQEVLNRSGIYLDAKPFGLALGEREPFNVETLERSVSRPRPPVASGMQPAATEPSEANLSAVRDIVDQIPILQRSSVRVDPKPEPKTTLASVPTQADADALQKKYESALDQLSKEGATRFHFVDYAPPSIVAVRKQLYLQISLRNPESFNSDETSIYKRAARSFDLFLAPLLNPILGKVPGDGEISGLDITVLNDLTAKASHSSEAIEFICPLKALRQFGALEITNQALLDQSLILVNGVRIALNLQQVE